MNDEKNKLLPRIFYLPAVRWSLIAVASFIVLFAGINHESIWFDETFSPAMARHDLAGIMEPSAGDVHPPLYYFILKLFMLIFGTSAAALRLPSVFGALSFVGPSRVQGPPPGRTVVCIVFIVFPFGGQRRYNFTQNPKTRDSPQELMSRALFQIFAAMGHVPWTKKLPPMYNPIVLSGSVNGTSSSAPNSPSNVKCVKVRLPT